MLSRIAKKLFKDPDSTDTDINLLLLGETGVGKSTFINSISNYFKYSNFNAAQKGKIEVLIPVHLNLSKYSKICGDPDKNEKHESGASATQHVKVYLFPIKMNGKVFNLRLVDTPGVGDPRGVDQDNIHIDNILAYLATLKKLHGICFVMKSNQSRLTSFVEYCLKQILTRLEKSASKNIIFITTYSKTAQYTAGETKFHCLEPLVKNIKSKPPHVDIPLNGDNVFALDNEAFKSLLEMQEGKKFGKHDKESFAESWAVSAKECRRLLIYIVGDSNTQPLKPHEVENTISINEVRFLIEQLSTPIAEVSELIQDNLRLLDRHKKNLSLEDQTLAQLKQQLYIPCIDLEVTELDQPVTVCTDTKCAEVVKVNDVTQWHYVQKCHNPCYLEGVPREMVGDPELVNCAAIDVTNTCTECGCDWRVHMHIYKTTKKVDVEKVDENVRDAIKDKEDAKIRIDALMKDLNKRMQELESEGDIIATSIANYSNFLQEHALTPFNDAYSDYIKQLIKNERNLGKFADKTVIENLQTLLIKHQHLQKTFQDSAKHYQKTGQSNLTPEAIKKSIGDLYNLKHMGRKIEELIKKSTACRNKETQKNFNCVVSQQIDLSADRGVEDERYQSAASTYSGSYGAGSEYSYKSGHNRGKSSTSKYSGTDDANSEYYETVDSTYRGSEHSLRSAKPSRNKPSRSEYSGPDYTLDGTSESYYDPDSSHYNRQKARSPPRIENDDERKSTKSSIYKHYSSGSKHKTSSRSVRPFKSGDEHDSDDDRSIISSSTYRTTNSSVKSKDRRAHSSDDDKSAKSSSTYRPTSRSVRSKDRDASNSDDDKSVKYSSTYYSASTKHQPHDPKYDSTKKSRKPHNIDSDDDKSVKSANHYSRDPPYESTSRSSRSLRRHSSGSDDNNSVKSSSKHYSGTKHSSKDSKYVSSAKSTTSSKVDSDDDKSVKYSRGEKGVKSSRSKHDSDDEKSVRSTRSEYSRHNESSGRKHLQGSDDDKSARSQKSEYSSKSSKSHSSTIKDPTYESSNRSERSSRSKHERSVADEDSDDHKSVRSSRTEYSTKSSQSKLNSQDLMYELKTKIEGSSKLRHHQQLKDKNSDDDDRSVRSSKTEYSTKSKHRQQHKDNDSDDDNKSVRSSKTEYSTKSSRSGVRSKDSMHEVKDKQEGSSKFKHRQQHKDEDSDDDKKSVRSSVSEYYSVKDHQGGKKSESGYYYNSKMSAQKHATSDKSTTHPRSLYYSNLSLRHSEKSKDSEDSFSDEHIYDTIEE